MQVFSRCCVVGKCENDFISQTGLKLDFTRLYTGSYNKSISSQFSSVTRIANKYNNSDIVGTVVKEVEITEIRE